MRGGMIPTKKDRSRRRRRGEGEEKEGEEVMRLEG